MENRAVTCQGGTQHPILTLVSLKVSVSPVPLPPGITWNSPDCQRADVLPSPPLTLKYTASSSRRYNISNWNDSNRAPESESFLFFFYFYAFSGPVTTKQPPACCQRFCCSHNSCRKYLEDKVPLGIILDKMIWMQNFFYFKLTQE